MKLTEENKTEIDAMTYEQMLTKWNHSTPRNPWFSGETGKYYRERMSTLKDKITKDNAFHQYY